VLVWDGGGLGGSGLENNGLISGTGRRLIGLFTGLPGRMLLGSDSGSVESGPLLGDFTIGCTGRMSGGGGEGVLAGRGDGFAFRRRPMSESLPSRLL
jgi:hypothetical protein